MARRERKTEGTLVSLALLAACGAILMASLNAVGVELGYWHSLGLVYVGRYVARPLQYD